MTNEHSEYESVLTEDILFENNTIEDLWRESIDNILCINCIVRGKSFNNESKNNFFYLKDTYSIYINWSDNKTLNISSNVYYWVNKFPINDSLNRIDGNTYSQVFPFNDNISILTFLNDGIDGEFKNETYLKSDVSITCFMQHKNSSLYHHCVKVNNVDNN